MDGPIVEHLELERPSLERYESSFHGYNHMFQDELKPSINPTSTEDCGGCWNFDVGKDQDLLYIVFLPVIHSHIPYYTIFCGMKSHFATRRSPFQRFDRSHMTG